MENPKKVMAKRISVASRNLIRISGNKTLMGITVYAQAMSMALKATGLTSYSGSPKVFLRTHIEAIEEFIKKNPPPPRPARKQKKQKVSRAPYQKPTTVSGKDVTSDAFLSTYEWRKLRMEALKKYGPKCMCCGATPATGAVMNVDHIKPRKLFPSLALSLDNLQILCHDCNHGKGNWDQTDWR